MRGAASQGDGVGCEGVGAVGESGFGDHVDGNAEQVVEVVAELHQVVQAGVVVEPDEQVEVAVGGVGAAGGGSDVRGLLAWCR